METEHLTEVRKARKRALLTAGLLYAIGIVVVLIPTAYLMRDNEFAPLVFFVLVLMLLSTLRTWLGQLRTRVGTDPSIAGGWFMIQVDGEQVKLPASRITAVKILKGNPYGPIGRVAQPSVAVGGGWTDAIEVSVQEGLVSRTFFGFGSDAATFVSQAVEAGATVGGDAMPETDPPRWYYMRESSQVGPVTKARMKHLLQTGEISADTLVWKDDMTDWEPASAKLGRHAR